MYLRDFLSILVTVLLLFFIFLLVVGNAFVKMISLIILFISMLSIVTIDFHIQRKGVK